MIKKILNNYFNELFKKTLKEQIGLRFNLDINFFEKNDICYLQLKPPKYKNYTTFLIWHKHDSLNFLINKDNEIDYIIKRINSMKDTDWN